MRSRPYIHVLIEVVADDPETLERRVNAVETLCVASDMLAKRLREQGRKIVCIVPEKDTNTAPSARRWADSSSSWGPLPRTALG